MAWLFRNALFALSTLFACAAFGQTVSFKQKDFEEEGIRLKRIDLRSFQQNSTSVPGQGFEVPGFELEGRGKARHGVGDDPAFATRAFRDTIWPYLHASEDSIVPGVGVHWVRYHVYFDQALREVPMILKIGSKFDIDVFVNGHKVLFAKGWARNELSAEEPPSDPLLRVDIPLTFLCDGRPEVIAVRVNGEPGAPLQRAALEASLHTADTNYAMQRSMAHYGVFIGVNLIILLLALVIWSLERHDRSWLLLALLALVAAVRSVCDIGADLGALGLRSTTIEALDLLDLALTPWPLYLLIMVLGVMRNDMSRKRARLYTIAAVLVTVICFSFGIGEIMGITDLTDGATILNDAPWIIGLGLLFALLFAVILGWFAVDVIRLGIQLLRSKGYARWIGGGALVSSVLTLVLVIVSEFTGRGLSAWLTVLADYSSYVAVPVSVAIYLAIRSAHHNQLVARQRDDLDLEVKERTSELTAEKERSDELLLNILPAEVAEELKRTGEAVAKHFDQASVLFTDFKGFTTMSESVSPAELLNELNTCFKAFDDIIGRYGVEKIKTIGDAYMCVGGLPDPTTSSPAAVVHAALEMQAFMIARKKERDAQGLPAFEMRVGIHTGPVVAGIVGIKKFQYDIWGDTVNTASRMESSGEVGQVNISEATYALVREVKEVREEKEAAKGPNPRSIQPLTRQPVIPQPVTRQPATEHVFTFTPRGKVHAKGKGEMEMYFVQRSAQRV